jgi:hypothetical protein
VYASEQTSAARQSMLSPCSPSGEDTPQGNAMSLSTILLIVVILILVGVLPTWPHARSWGYGPSGVVGVILIILIVLLLTGRL